MTYQELLCTSAKDVGNCTCMGLDPQLSCLPGEDSEPVRDRLNTYYRQLFRRMNLSGLAPAAFKPNIGFFAVLDHPREEDFSGSQALSDVLDMVENFFPGIPVILDAKRGTSPAAARITPLRRSMSGEWTPSPSLRIWGRIPSLRSPPMVRRKGCTS